MALYSHINWLFPFASWRGTACKGTGLSRGRGVWPSTSPPGGVWRRRTSRRAQSPKPVAAARPLTMTTASNPNVALRNKIKNNNNTTANTTSQQANPPLPLSSLFLEHHFEFPFVLIFFLLSFLHKGKTNHIPVKGEIPAPPDVVFPAFPPSLQSLPSLTPHPPFSYFLFLPRFVELKCSSRKEGQWMHTWFCFKQTNSFHWWCRWHIINDINKNWFLTSWYVSIWIWLLWCLSPHAFYFL